MENVCFRSEIWTEVAADITDVDDYFDIEKETATDDKGGLKRVK